MIEQESRGPGRPKGSTAGATKGLVKRTRKILGELYADASLHPPLVLLWHAANDVLRDRAGGFVELDAETRIRAAVAAAAYSHVKPIGNGDGDAPVIQFHVNLGPRIPDDMKDAIEAKFKDITEEAVAGLESDGT